MGFPSSIQLFPASNSSRFMSTSTSCCSRSIFSWILKGPPQTRHIPETMGKSRGKHMETYGQKPLAYGGLVIVGTSSVNMGGTWWYCMVCVSFPGTMMFHRCIYICVCIGDSSPPIIRLAAYVMGIRWFGVILHGDDQQKYRGSLVDFGHRRCTKTSWFFQHFHRFFQRFFVCFLSEKIDRSQLALDKKRTMAGHLDGVDRFWSQ